MGTGEYRREVWMGRNELGSGMEEAMLTRSV